MNFKNVLFVLLISSIFLVQYINKRNALCNMQYNTITTHTSR